MTEVKTYVADSGKVFQNFETGEILGREIVLGLKDSIIRYIEVVDEPEAEVTP